MEDQCRRLVDDELINTGNGMRANDGAWVTEKLNELWNEDIEWTVEGIRVQLIRAILTNLVKCTKGTLHHMMCIASTMIPPSKVLYKRTSPPTPPPPPPPPTTALQSTVLYT